MPNTVKIAFKHVPYAVEFEHREQTYTKTNFNRGYYFKDGIKVFRKFKKHTLIKTSSEYFDIIIKKEK